MTFDIFVRYLHFLSILIVVSAVVSEHLLARRRMSRKEIAVLAKVDALYGIAAIVVLLTGIAQWFWTGKPAGFYTPNPVFHVKVTLFVIVGLVSIAPTMFFVKNRKGDPEEEIDVPTKVVMCLRVEMLLLFLIPLLGVLVGRGVGIPLAE